MSLPTQIPQTPITKTTTVDNPQQSIPTSLEVTLNEQSNSLKPAGTFSKAADPKSLDPEAFRRLSFSTISGLSDDGRTGRSGSHVSHSRYTSHSPAPPTTWHATFRLFWERNRGLWLVAMSQFFGALMNVTTRLLELDGEGMHPFQVLFVRMGMTVILCCAYMWYTKVPYFPLGKKEVRKLLVVRGLSGFFGIFGMYYSLLYLPLADATVITFLAPALAGYGCYILFNEPFTRTEQIASFVSLLGVILIARPTSFFHLSTPSMSTDPSSPPGGTFNTTSSAGADGEYHFPVPTSAQRLSAIAISLLGAVGAACVFTTLRWIGPRAHPLISVNYFATWCVIVSSLALSIGPYLPFPSLPSSSSTSSSPSIHFALPSSLKQWAMLFFLGICGFIMQFMMTAGLAHEKSKRATNMVYTNMLFAGLFDRFVFGTVPGMWSLLGSGLILGSAVWVAVQKGRGQVAEQQWRRHEERPGLEDGVLLLGDEERAVLGGIGVGGEVEGQGRGGQSMPLMEIRIRNYDGERV